MQQNVTELSPQQNQAIELLISGKNACNIADELGISRQTLWRWRQMQLFQAAYRAGIHIRRQAMREMVDAILEKSLWTVLQEVNSLEKSNYDRFERAVTILKLFKSAPHTMVPESPLFSIEDEDEDRDDEEDDGYD